METTAHHSTLADRIAAFLEKDELRIPLQALEKQLPDTADVYIVGGSLRDVVIRECHGNGPVTEDIDIIIGNLGEATIAQSGMPAGRCEPTELGGVRWLPERTRFAFDLSRLQDFLIFRKFNLQPNLENLLASLDFTCNAIIFDRKSATLNENGCVQAIRRRLLDFNTTMFYNRETITYRALLLWFKTGFILSKAVFEFLKTRVDMQVLTFVKARLSVRLSPEQAKTVLNDYVRISGFSDYGRYRSWAEATGR